MLDYLLRQAPGGLAAETLGDWAPRWLALAGRFERPIDAALAAGFGADRLGFAFAGGYHAALRALVPGAPHDHLVALSATEERGAHPRSIVTSLVSRDDAFVLTGEKRWTTMAPVARELLVLASLGKDEGGRNRLRLARVDARAPGVHIEPMPETPFVPEIPHARIRFEDVKVAPVDLLEGDGWERYVKPFRTIEDLHVHAALLGYLLGVARRFAWPESERERLLALIVAARGLALEPTEAAETHLALAGLLEQSRVVVEQSSDHWKLVEAAEMQRWQRDRSLLQVAASAREARRKRAWERISGVEIAGGEP